MPKFHNVLASILQERKVVKAPIHVISKPIQKKKKPNIAASRDQNHVGLFSIRERKVILSKKVNLPP